jgi:hypothetical protein
VAVAALVGLVLLPVRGASALTAASGGGSYVPQGVSVIGGGVEEFLMSAVCNVDFLSTGPGDGFAAGSGGFAGQMVFEPWEPLSLAVRCYVAPTAIVGFRYAPTLVGMQVFDGASERALAGFSGSTLLDSSLSTSGTLFAVGAENATCGACSTPTAVDQTHLWVQLEFGTAYSGSTYDYVLGSGPYLSGDGVYTMDEGSLSMGVATWPAHGFGPSGPVSPCLVVFLSPDPFANNPPTFGVGNVVNIVWEVQNAQSGVTVTALSGTAPEVTGTVNLSPLSGEGVDHLPRWGATVTISTAGTLLDWAYKCTDSAGGRGGGGEGGEAGGASDQFSLCLAGTPFTLSPSSWLPALGNLISCGAQALFVPSDTSALTGLWAQVQAKAPFSFLYDALTFLPSSASHLASGIGSGPTCSGAPPQDLAHIQSEPATVAVDSACGLQATNGAALSLLRLVLLAMFVIATSLAVFHETAKVIG